MIKIYGSPRSSARRCFWTLEELGLPYERQPLDMQKKEHKEEKFLKINPNGKIPCLIDGDFVIWESMAINTYLCEKYNKQLLGKSPEEQGEIFQWSFWSLVELQKPLIDMFIQIVFIPEERRDLDLIERSRKAAEPLLHILDAKLAGQQYLVGNRFTLADLHVSSVAMVNFAIHNDISKFKNLSQWLTTCTNRPACKKVMEMN